jgi:hypothetical protein
MKVDYITILLCATMRVDVRHRYREPELSRLLFRRNAMALAISPDEIVAKIEQTWLAKRPSKDLAALDDYVEWLSRNWTMLSDVDRQLLIDGGAVLFDAKLRDW